MLTEKDYEAIADAFAKARHMHSPDYASTLDQFLENLGTYFKQDNPRFDRWKFFEACYKPLE